MMKTILSVVAFVFSVVSVAGGGQAQSARKPSEPDAIRAEARRILLVAMRSIDAQGSPEESKRKILPALAEAFLRARDFENASRLAEYLGPPPNERIHTPRRAYRSYLET